MPSQSANAFDMTFLAQNTSYQHLCQHCVPFFRLSRLQACFPGILDLIGALISYLSKKCHIGTKKYSVYHKCNVRSRRMFSERLPFQTTTGLRAAGMTTVSDASQHTMQAYQYPYSPSGEEGAAYEVPKHQRAEEAVHGPPAELQSRVEVK